MGRIRRVLNAQPLVVLGLLKDNVTFDQFQFLPAKEAEVAQPIILVPVPEPVVRFALRSVKNLA
jgi:hypothetical protein